jgi:hypothetical protein
MNQKLILGLPDSPLVQELQFHLSEMRRDLVGLVQSLDTARIPEILDTTTTAALHYQIEAWFASLDHTLRYHLVRALELWSTVAGSSEGVTVAQQIIALQPRLFDGDDTSAEDIIREGVHVEDVPSAVGELRMNVRELTNALAEVQAQIERLTDMQRSPSENIEHINDVLTQLASALIAETWPVMVRLFYQAVQIHNIVDPDQVSDQAEDDTPLRELTHPQARSLTSCPWCHASLSADDRTFDGSYCEMCQTLWHEGIETTHQ